MAPKPKNIIRSLKNGADAPPVAGFLEYKPGPGIYSRLERAVQQLPENVRAQELPGLLKRYKDGIPGWELKAVDLDSVVAGRTTVPRDELLAAVRERSPVFTHKEVVLGGRPQQGVEFAESEDGQFRMPVLSIDRQQTPSQIGAGVSHGQPRYEDYGQGGDDYSEVLLLQPYARGDLADTHHWNDSPVGALHDPKWSDGDAVVAHLRHDTHGDALRINEIQSDIANHNIRTMKRLDRRPGRSESDYPIPFQLEDSYRELLAKRALLEAARGGHRAIEVASPESVAQKVGMPIEHAEHLYGKVIPSDVERLGRKLGGIRTEAVDAPVISDVDPEVFSSALLDASISPHQPIQMKAQEAYHRATRAGAGDFPFRPTESRDYFHHITEPLRRVAAAADHPRLHMERATDLRDSIAWLVRKETGIGVEESVRQADKMMPGMMSLASEYEAANAAYNAAHSAVDGLARRTQPPAPVAYRGVISDEMRKNIINNGIPAAIAIGVGTGLATGGNEAEAGPLQSASDAAARAAMPASTVNSIRRLKQQVDAAYVRADQTQNPADFKKAENLDAKLEQQYEKWDSRLEDLDEGDGDVDLEEDDPQGSYDEDMEPNDYEGDSANYEEQMRDIYGSYVAGGPHYLNEKELADALRGIGRDTETAKQISDEDIIREAKAAFDKRQAHVATVRDGSPVGGIREMQARLRDQGAASVPFMAMAQSVNENRELPTGSGGGWSDIRKNLVGDFDFSMAISPEEWEDYYQKGESAEHQRFKGNVAEVMNQPIIRVGAANNAQLLVDGDQMDRITPAQFVKEYLDIYGRNLDETARAQVAGSVMARLDGSSREPNFMADDIVDRMMGSLRESSPQGKYAKMDPVPQEQLDSMRQQHGDWADSMLTPGTAENFEALRGYELLRTTLDGQHAPVYADNLSNAAAFVGGFVDPKSRQNFGDATFSSGPEGRFRRANRDYFSSRTRPDEPAAFRDPGGISRFASTSASNIQGMLRAGGDTSNWIGAASWPLYESFSEFSRTPVGKAVTGEGLPALWEGGDDWKFMAQKRKAFDREQPIQPAGMTREEFDRQLADHRRDREQGEAWGATTFPNVQGAFDAVTGGKTQKTWGPPLYNDYGPNFLANTVGNIPSAAIMAGSAATGGLLGGLSAAAAPKTSLAKAATTAASGVARGAARGAGATVTSQIKDAPFDFATDQAVGGALGGGLQSYIDYMTSAEQNNALLPDVNPEEISLEGLNRKRAAALETREDRFRRNKFDWNRR